MIRFGDTTAQNCENLYRFQVDSYPHYDMLRLYENHGRKAREKTVKTIYDESGYAWLADIATGEIIRRKKAPEIKRCVDTSVARARKVMREILMSNNWKYFLTLTFNNIEQDRTDKEAVIKQWTKFRKEIRRKFPEMRYLAVAEEHKDGCIHFHLVVGGITAEQLRLIDSGHYDKNGRKIYNCYAWKYGITTVTEVENTEGVSGYMLKYVGKSLGISDDFKKRYWCSRNCNRPKKRFVDIVTDYKVKVADFFDCLVDRTITMTTQFYQGCKNYIAVKDFEPALRKTTCWFKVRPANLECHYKNTIGGRSYSWRCVKPKPWLVDLV